MDLLRITTLDGRLPFLKDHVTGEEDEQWNCDVVNSSAIFSLGDTLHGSEKKQKQYI